MILDSDDDFNDTDDETTKTRLVQNNNKKDIHIFYLPNDD